MPVIAAPPPKKLLPASMVPFKFTAKTAAQARARRLELDRRRKIPAYLKAFADAPSLDAFQALRLLRVRAQIEKVEAMIFRERDAQKLDRLASAQARLFDQERLLSGRQEPGRKGARRDRPSGEAMLDLGKVAPAATSSEVSPAPVAPPPPPLLRLAGDVTP